MRIRTVKKINLPELIQYVWENKVYPSRFVPEEFGTTRYVEFSDGGMFRAGHGLHDYDTFTVEVEEDLTKNTVLSGFAVITTNEELMVLDSHKSIDTVLRFQSTYKDVKFDKLYAKHAGELHCVWTREHGIPEEGVLEVGAE